MFYQGKIACGVNLLRSINFYRGEQVLGQRSPAQGLSQLLRGPAQWWCVLWFLPKRQGK